MVVITVTRLSVPRILNITTVITLHILLLEHEVGVALSTVFDPFGLNAWQMKKLMEQNQNVYLVFVVSRY